MTDMRDLRGRFTPQNPVARFWSKVDIRGVEECWPWIAGKWNCKMPIPYGSFRGFDGKMTRAHRVAYELYYGVNCKGWAVRHKCDNPPCCNPRHLQLGTIADNNEDKITRRRHAFGERSWNAKLTAADVINIRSQAAQGAKLTALAQRFGVHPVSIGQIKAGKRWKHLL